MSLQEKLHSFLVPSFDGRFFIRLAVLIAVTVTICRFVVTPAFTNGESMVPTYRSGQFVPVWRPAFWFSAPQAGQVVMIRYGGEQVLLLKRVVATAGQTVEFRRGKLFIDGAECTDSWASFTPCDWELEPRTVPEGEVYVVGDNRDMLMESHLFGHVAIELIVGVPLW